MWIVDANVLLYSVNEDAPNHDLARDWLDGALGGTESVGFDLTVILAFLRLSTHRLFTNPLSVEQAFDVMESWLAQPLAIFLEPTTRHLHLLRGLLSETGTAANLVGDAHLAALAVQHGAGVCSFDGDFSRFSGVRWQRPGAEGSANRP